MTSGASGRDRAVHLRLVGDAYEVAIKGRTNAIIAAVIARLTQTEADILEDYLAGDTAMEITRRRNLQSLECRAITLTIIHKLLAANRVIWKTLIEINPDILARIEAFVVKYGVPDRLELQKNLATLSKEHQSLLEQSLRDGSLEAFLKFKSEAATTSTPNRDAPPNGHLYNSRPDRKETAPAFIERVYGGAGWLTGEFTRADLRKLDAAAEMALRNWERTNGRASVNLPTVKERNDQQTAPGGVISDETREAIRIAERHRSAIRRQLKRKKTP